MLSLVLALALQAGTAEPLAPPVVGQIAPPLGHVEWLQLDGKPVARTLGGPTLQGLRGKVVIVHTYGYYCDS